MLVPLETFSGWPQVANPSPLQSLGLLIGIPLLIAVIVIALIELAPGPALGAAMTRKPATHCGWVLVSPLRWSRSATTPALSRVIR
jgi:hypothetical protein